MLNFMNQPNQQMTFANGCLTLAEWAAAAFSKLQRRGVLDFDRAMWQFVYILIQPRLVYKDSVFHKQTNSTWAREDPAFMITLTMFMFAAAVAYGVAFSEPIVEFGFLILEVVVIHLYLASAALATVAWMLASTRLKSESISAHAMGSARVEWLFAFEIQCNAFVPVFVLLYVVQYLLLPLLLQPGILALLLSNTLFAAAASWYSYLLFLGYSVLEGARVLSGARVFLMLPPLVAVAFLAATASGTNASRLVLGTWFSSVDE